MLEIPGIDPDKVERYGKQFLQLIRNAQHGYETLMQQQESCPLDPNHINVIDISSDDDYGGDEDFDELGGENCSQEEQSSYFQAPPEVDAFNARGMSSGAPFGVSLTHDTP